MNETELFYKNHYDFYKSKYWSTIHSDINIPNGFKEYPLREYNYFSDLLNQNVVTKDCRIIDMCCGNGLLLKHLQKNCNFYVTPFGIDFQENSIEQAKKIIHPSHKDNFITQNATDFDFTKNQFDIIIIDPYHFTSIDLKILTKKIIENVELLTVFYSYSDVLLNLNYKTISDFPSLNLLGLDTYNYEELSIGLYVSDKKRHTT